MRTVRQGGSDACVTAPTSGVTLTVSDLLNASLRGLVGQMTALRGDDVVAIPLAEAIAGLKVVPREWHDVGCAFFG